MRNKKPISVSLDPEIHERAVKFAMESGFKSSFSSWLGHLIERSLDGKSSGGRVNHITIPMSNGVATVPYPMTEEDFEMLVQTLNLWKPRLVKNGGA